MKNLSLLKLFALFGGLLLVFAAVRMFRSPRLEGNMPANLTDIDTASVTELIITPGKGKLARQAGGQEEIRLVKSGGWKLKQGDRDLRLEQGAGTNVLRTLMSLKPQRMISKRKEKWDSFGVGDSTGTRVKVMAEGSIVSDLWIGRAGFTQVPGQQYGGGTYTYVRLNDEDEVYSVDGFLEGQFNRKLDDWRDKSFMRLKRDSVARITFRYPADSSFVVEKINGKWMLGPEQADSAAVVSYLRGMEYKNVQTFAETEPAGAPGLKITFEGKNNTVATIEGWPSAAGLTLRGASQKETFFIADAAAQRDIFVGREKFVGKR